MLIALNSFQIRIQKLVEFSIITLIAFLLMIFSHDEGGQMITRFLSYFFPFSIMLISEEIDKIRFKKIIIYVLVLAVIVGLVEFYLLKGIFSYVNFTGEDGYLRIVTIFLNPNNAGLILTLGFIYLYEILNGNNFVAFTVKYLFLGALAYVIYLTGSKTPIVLLFIYFVLINILYFFKPEKIRINRKLFSYVSVISLITFLSGIYWLNNRESVVEDNNTRSFDLETGSIRFEQFEDYITKAGENPIAPDYYFTDLTYDLSMLQIWSDFSLIGLVLFTGFICYKFRTKIYYFDRKSKAVFLLIIMASFSLQIFYIWPPAYIFWYFIYSNKLLYSEQTTN